MSIQLTVIIVNFNTSSLLKSCLRSLFSALKQSNLIAKTEVIIVDNASKDDSVEMVKKEFNHVLMIQNKENAGFAKANNLGISKAKGAYILLLNSDTEIQGDSIIMSLEALKKSDSAGVAGTVLYNPDRTVQSSSGFFPNLFRIFAWMFFLDDIPYIKNIVKPYHYNDIYHRSSTKSVDWVTGAFLMVKKETIDRAGRLDENIFMYGEEVEWCYRIKKAGYEVLYVPSDGVIHKKGGSSKDGRMAGVFEEFHFIRYFFKKYKSKWQQILVGPILKFGALSRLILFGIITNNRESWHLYGKAFKMA